MKKFIKPLWFLVLCFIWGNSMIPVSKSEAISISVMEATNDIVDRIESVEGVESSEKKFSLPSIRKIAHLLEFAAFGALTYLVMIPKSRQDFVNLFSFGLFVGFMDETIQLFPEGRGSYVTDVWIDVTGYVLGVIFIHTVSFFYEKKQKAKEPKEVLV